MPRRIATAPAARLCALALLLALLATPSPALEKVARRAVDLDRDEWAAGATVSIAYYNTCTGWIWTWWDWEDYDAFGVNFVGGESGQVLESNWWHFWSAAPAGWGYHATIDVFAADGDGCPQGNPLASQVYSPQEGWNLTVWGGLPVPDSFVVLMRLGPWGHVYPLRATSDHPAPGPTGPQACGTCYPTTRENHSYRYGPTDSPLCPGSPFFDGVCDAQLFLDAQLVYPVPVEEQSWGKLKGLYR